MENGTMSHRLMPRDGTAGDVDGMITGLGEGMETKRSLRLSPAPATMISYLGPQEV